MASSLKQHKREQEEGFTLIELLVVVIIIGILAAIAIPVFLNQRESAWRSAAESDARNAAIEIESFFTRTDAYPDTDFSVDADTASPAGLDITVSNGVTLAYDVDGGDESYLITATHDELPTGDSVTYDPALGGLQSWTFAAAAEAPAAG